MLTHATFRVTGERLQLAAFDARLKLLFAEQQVNGDIEEQHADDALHYDLKVEGGIPFPPFALASCDFPELEIAVEWVEPGAGTCGSARIVGGALAAQNTEHVGGVGAEHALSIRFDANGCLALALAVLSIDRDECRGYALTGREDALFRVVREPDTGGIELFATHGEAAWSRRWHVIPGRTPEYSELDSPQPISSDEFRALETLAQGFVAEWIWFGNGPREEIAIEAERYQRLGCTVRDANLRSSALHRIKSAGSGDGVLHYSTLGTDAAWVEEVVARCWPGGSAE